MIIYQFFIIPNYNILGIIQQYGTNVSIQDPSERAQPLAPE